MSSNRCLKWSSGWHGPSKTTHCLESVWEQSTFNIYWFRSLWISVFLLSIYNVCSTRLNRLKGSVIVYDFPFESVFFFNGNFGREIKWAPVNEDEFRWTKVRERFHNFTHNPRRVSEHVFTGWINVIFFLSEEVLRLYISGSLTNIVLAICHIFCCFFLWFLFIFFCFLFSL